MSAMTSQITSLSTIYSTVYSVADQIKHQSSVSLAFAREIHRWPVTSPHKGPVTRKMLPFDDVIMNFESSRYSRLCMVYSICLPCVWNACLSSAHHYRGENLYWKIQGDAPRGEPIWKFQQSIQYIPRNMHTVLLCFALLWLCNRS